MDSHPVPFSLLSIVLCVHASKLYRWYKHLLSDYKRQQARGELHKHDLVLPGGETVGVPILEPKHLGQQMAVDEKHIDGEFYTVLTNKTTGKIAMLAQTVRHQHLADILQPYLHSRYEVNVLTRDLANTYDWLGRTCFPNAVQVADKFHIIRQALDQLQAHRLGYRQERLLKRRQAWKQHKLEAKGQPFRYNEPRLENGETHLELLARGRYVLYKFPNQWSQSQKERAQVLFRHYPSIKTAYRLICSFRRWYRKEFVGDPRPTITNRLQTWYAKVDQADIMEITAFKALVERHQGVIINYFEQGHTNALAEATNKKINTFIRNNQGVKDKDFFFFRIKNYFT